MATLAQILQPLLREGITLTSNEDGGRESPVELVFHENGKRILTVHAEGGDELGGWMEYHL